MTLQIILFLNLFIIFWAIIGYPLSIKILEKIFINKRNIKDYSLEPTVTVLIVAHNEEKVIKNKLKNVIDLDYPREKINIIVSSDNSNDNTNTIVGNFINDHLNQNIKLYQVKERKGKTNAQNEAVETINSEFIVLTDANSMLKKNSIKELMASFVSDDICYVTGKLSFINDNKSNIAKLENTYWDSDTQIRDIESRIQTITAGNGALYACRKIDYHDFDSIESHDSSMPIYYALNSKRAIANHDAIAYEKAGENIKDEFNRKVRMNRVLLRHILPDIRILNIFKYNWFSYFYFGHRTCRYLLWFSHLIILIMSMMLFYYSWLFAALFIVQVVFYFIAIIASQIKTKNKIINLIFYYSTTIVAQWFGVINTIFGRSKPIWDKAESTR